MNHTDSTLATAAERACASVCIEYKAVPADGRWYETNTAGDDPRGRGDGRIKLFPDGEGGIVCNWRTGEMLPFFIDDGRKLNDDERRERDQRREKARRQAAAEEAKRQKEAAKEAAAIWQDAKPAADHPYLAKKGVKPFGVRVHGGALVVPVLIDGGVSSLQFIEEAGGKRFLPGGRIRGGSFTIGTIEGAPKIAIAEGYATAATVHEATGLPVVVAFNAGNLEPVARSVREKNPGAAVVVCADDDFKTEGNPGMTKARAAAAAIGGIVAVPDFGPDRPEKATDFNDQGRHSGLESVARCVDAAAPLAPSMSTPTPPAPDPRLLYNPNRTTDLGNAERLLALRGSDIRYVREIGWHVWKDGRWCRDEIGVRQLFKDHVVSKLYQEAADKALAHDSAAVKELSSWARRSEHDKQVSGALSMAMSEPGVYIQPEDLDREPWILNVANGSIDLKTGALRPHRREDLITKLSPVVFDPAATAPAWEAFLHRIMDGKQDLIDFLRRAVGYSLTGRVSEQCWFLMHGVGANGKGTFINTILRILGDYATQAAPDLLMLAKGEASRHPTEQADLFGRRLAVCQETEEGRRLAEVAVKQMTGGDRIKARHMRMDFFEFEPTHKLWLATNHKPVIRDTTVSTWRRIRMIPFAVVIPEAERDGTLQDRLLAESSGVLAWAVRGCLEWQRDGLKPPAEVIAATETYRQSQDILAAFLAERCYIPKSAPWAVKTSAKNLYQAYTEWCEESGEHPKSQRVFGEALTERGFRKAPPQRGYIFWEGIGILEGLAGRGEDGDLGDRNPVSARKTYFPEDSTRKVVTKVTTVTIDPTDPDDGGETVI